MVCHEFCATSRRKKFPAMYGMTTSAAAWLYVFAERTKPPNRLRKRCNWPGGKWNAPALPQPYEPA